MPGNLCKGSCLEIRVSIANQRKSSNQSDPNCQSLSNKRLSPPPYSSDDFYTTKVKRALVAANVSFERSFPHDAFSNFQFGSRCKRLTTMLTLMCIILALGRFYFLLRRNSRQTFRTLEGVSNLKEGSVLSGLKHGRPGKDDPEDVLSQDHGTAEGMAISRSGLSYIESNSTQLRKRTRGKLQSLQEMQNRVLSHNSRGQYDQAAQAQAKVVAEMKRVKGQGHPETLDSMTNLTYIYRHQGQYQEARKLQEDLLQLLKKGLGEDHPSVLDHTIILSDTCQKILQLHIATKPVDDDPRTSSIRVERHHTITLNDMELFSDFFMGKGEIELALQWLDSHFSLCVRLYGRIDSKTIASMSRLCMALQVEELKDYPSRQAPTAGSQKDILKAFVSAISDPLFAVEGPVIQESINTLAQATMDLEAHFGDVHWFGSISAPNELWSMLLYVVLIISGEIEYKGLSGHDPVTIALRRGYVKEANTMLKFWLSSSTCFRDELASQEDESHISRDDRTMLTIFKESALVDHLHPIMGQETGPRQWSHHMMAPHRPQKYIEMEAKIASSSLGATSRDHCKINVERAPFLERWINATMDNHTEDFIGREGNGCGTDEDRAAVGYRYTRADPPEPNPIGVLALHGSQVPINWGGRIIRAPRRF